MFEQEYWPSCHDRKLQFYYNDSGYSGEEEINEDVSNCCGSPIEQQDKNGHGKCSDCGDNCVPYKTENV